MTFQEKTACWCEFLLFALYSLFGIVGGPWLLSSGLSSPKSVLRTAPYGVVENGPFSITPAVRKYALQAEQRGEFLGIFICAEDLSGH